MIQVLRKRLSVAALLGSAAVGIATLGMGAALHNAALAQVATGNSGTSPISGAYGCPAFLYTAARGYSAICAEPGNNFGNTVPASGTANGNIGAAHYWSRSTLQAGSVAVASGCGTSPNLVGSSSDTTGIITLGTGSPTTCAITFATPYAIAPAVFITQETGTAQPYVVLPTTNGFTITWGTSPGAVKIHWFTIGTAP